MKIFDLIFRRSDLSPNRQKVIKNVYWAVLGKVVNIVSGLLVGVMVARYLGPENYGLMNYVISYVAIFSVLSSFGLDNIEVRELSKANANKEILLGSAFTIRIICAILAILLILTTLIIFEADSFTFTMVMIYSVSLIFSTLNVIRNYFTSIVLNEYVVKTEISRTIIGSGIKVLLLLNHCPLEWFIAASTFNFLLVDWGYLYSYLNKVGPVLTWRSDLSVIRMLAKEAFPMLLSGTAVIIYQQINVIMIRHMMDDASAGQFSAAAKLTELAVFIPMVVAQTVTPLLVKAHQENTDHYHIKRQQFVDLMVWSSIIMAVAMSVFASPAIRLLFGDEYLKAIPVLQIMAWRAVLVALFGSSGQIILIEGMQRYAVVRNLIGCGASVLFNFIFIPLWGINGAAVATVLTMALSGYLSHFVIRPYRYLVAIQTRAIIFGWKQFFRWPILRK